MKILAGRVALVTSLGKGRSIRLTWRMNTCWYGERLPTVEINNTFYRMPKSEVVANWGAQVPDGFRFTLKASRRITHLKRLNEVEEPLGYLVKNAGRAGGQTGLLAVSVATQARQKHGTVSHPVPWTQGCLMRRA